MSKLAREVRALLSAAGWRFLRHGKGDHEIWIEPATGTKVVLDGGMKSRHSANGVLRQAGLPKTF